MEHALKQLSELVDGRAFETRIPFRLPELLRKTKPDSKITLQLLYCPTGTKEIPNPHWDEGMDRLKEARQLHTIHSIRLSNRLEFNLSEVVSPD